MGWYCMSCPDSLGFSRRCKIINLNTLGRSGTYRDFRMLEGSLPVGRPSQRLYSTPHTGEHVCPPSPTVLGHNADSKSYHVNCALTKEGRRDEA